MKDPQDRFSDRLIEVVTAALADRIRQRRLSLGLSVEVVARSLGIAAQQLEKYESGKNRLTGVRLYQLGKILAVPVSFFFEGIEDRAKT